jgi:GNAT superfamily N-acetyltransferase
LTFRSYSPADAAACLRLFDANCPAAFAPNEREDYVAFLAGPPGPYDVVVVDDDIVGAAGLEQDDDGLAVRWIVVDPRRQGHGLGRALMAHLVAEAKRRGARRLAIATSHKSAAFFARLGAVAHKTTADGWGPGMHRIDMTLTLD